MNCGLSEGTCGVIKGILRSTSHTAISTPMNYLSLSLKQYQYGLSGCLLAEIGGVMERHHRTEQNRTEQNSLNENEPLSA